MKIRITIISTLLVFSAAVVLQFMNVRDVKGGDQHSERRPIALARQIPTTVVGWDGRDEPLGTNEAVSTAVERTLNYDDYVFRVFRKGSVTVGIYVAYWSPGRMPIQKVASHTPDRCWTENGWRCLEKKHGAQVATRAGMLRPSQWRAFEPPAGGAREFVLYWHLVGKRLYDYGSRFNATPRITDWWRDTLAYAASGSDAQYFIRVTSNRDFSALQGDPGWEELMVSLAALGLVEPVASAK